MTNGEGEQPSMYVERSTTPECTMQYNAQKGVLWDTEGALPTGVMGCLGYLLYARRLYIHFSLNCNTIYIFI